MAYLPLYRKYRSQTFSEIIGQEHVSRTLANAITEDRVAHAYLFTGPRGTGKTSTARILAKALNCELGPTPEPCGKCPSCIAIAEGSSMDVIELDAASHSGVDETREVLAGVALATAGGRKKVYVIDEVHMLTTQSFNALLKTLEEPPGHVVFVLATTEAHKVLPTIVSRTQRFDFRRIPAELLAEHLGNIAKLESIDIEPDALGVIARHADGGARDALSALDQLASLGGTVTAREAERLLGAREEDAFVALFDAIERGDVGSIFTTLDSLITQGADVRQLAIGALQHARSLLLLKTAPTAENLLDVAEEDRPRLAEQADRFRIGGLLRTLDLIGKAITEMRNAPNHRLFLEVALARAGAPETDPSPEGVLARIERLERRLSIEGAASPSAPTQLAPEKPAAPAPDSETQRVGPAPAPDIEAHRVQPAPASDSATERVEPAPAPEKPATPEKQPTSVPQAAVAGDHVGLGHVADAWQITMKEVNRRSRRVGAYLNPSRPVSLDDDGLVVEVQSSFHAGSMSEPENRDILAEAVHAALGIRPTVRFAERGAAPQPVKDEEGSASSESSEGSVADYAESEDLADGEHDPIELVRKGFGAEVVKEIEGGTER